MSNTGTGSGGRKTPTGGSTGRNRNAFCFRQSRSAQDDAAVLWFSVQREKLVELGESFDGLLRRYVRDLRPSPVPVASV